MASSSAAETPADQLAIIAAANPPADGFPEERKYGGWTRFEIENEFVSCLANPRYLQHLAVNKFFDKPEFIAYLNYLLYWTEPPYIKYLLWPFPTLRHLKLLQNEQFRNDLINPEFIQRLEEQTLQSTLDWHKNKDT